MKSFLKKVLSIAALLCVVAVEANNVTPTVAYRSQGFHADRQRNVGMVGHTNLYDMDSWYGVFDLGVGYLRSFRDNQIAKCLFGDDIQCDDDCGSKVLVQGSKVANRACNAWMADNLYLNCEYDSCFTIQPLLQNVVVDLDLYLGFDEWCTGMYFRVYGPITWAKWDTRFCDSTCDALTSSCSTGYMTPSGDEVLLNSACEYFSGQSPASVDGVEFQCLRYAKMPNCDRTRTGFAELRAELGWNFLTDEDYHMSVGLHVAAPTGSKRQAEFVLDPVVGNGNHWELGGTIHGHYVFWRSCDEDKHFGFYGDAVITHLFKADEQRTFDLNCKDNSRYMLASKFTKTVTNELSGNTTAGTTPGTLATHQFANEYAPVANLTTSDVKVSVGVQADVVAMFNYTACGFSWDLGYNFWGRSCESIDCPNDCDPCNQDNIFLAKNRDTWALKGDARMFGFAGADAGALSEGDSQPLSSTQNKATMRAGTNGTENCLSNAGVDNAQFATVTNGGTSVRLLHTPIAQGGENDDANQVSTSIQPVFINCTDVALQETRGLSHKVFTNLSWTWDRDECIPFIGIGGSAEFGQNEGCKDDCNPCDDCCNNCIKCSLSQWSVWVKGGISFN